MGFDSPKWVLVVDDDKDIRELLEHHLIDRFGKKIRIVSSPDGLDATRRLPFQAFDCIVTDLRMPRKEGESFISAVRGSQLNEHTPIIVVTGNPISTLESEYPYVYQMTKPIAKDTFLDLVENQISLGKTDQRLDANIINIFLQNITNFQKIFFKIECQISAPQAKAVGDRVHGEVFKIIELTIGKNKSSHLLATDEKYLSSIKKYFSFEDEHVSLEKVHAILFKNIYNNALKDLGLSGNVKVDGKEVFTREDEDSVERLSEAKGIEIKCTTDLGILYYYSFWD